MTHRQRYAHLQVGDVVRFGSRPRRVVAVYYNGVQFVQIRDGHIGGRHFHKTTHADGVRRTTYTWSDLANAQRRAGRIRCS